MAKLALLPVLRDAWRYYANFVIARAWHDTVTIQGWRPILTIIWAISYLAGLLGLAWARGWTFAVDELISGLFLSLIPVAGVAIYVLGYNLFMTPVRIHKEQENRLRQEASREALIDALNRFILEGNLVLSELKLSANSGDNVRILTAIDKEMKWSRRVSDFLSKEIPQQSALFTSAAGVPTRHFRNQADLWANETEVRITRLHDIVKIL